ncbi:hypothetical protein HU230_0009900 [Bradyrhizobium quebecense]|uniref:hypothetical protein n=1 Tax=Bradyrhizobium quebecense TaxID=2748629 RepID=UPI001CD76602|nr:hypothetical protein [Bradyrhizobium quebecense]UGA46319.1 hypothetical protein HU230_0009900 [Bradyrhizobium quebecense]
MAWLTADCTRASLVAAARKLPLSAMVTKTRIWSSVRLSSVIYEIDQLDVKHITPVDDLETLSVVARTGRVDA